MTTAVQHRRGTTAEHSTFTGLEGEVTIDTTKDTAVIHDGALAGGYPLAKETLSNANPSSLGALTGASTASDDQFVIYDTSVSQLKKISLAELNNAITAEPLDTVDINGGTIDGTVIGGSSAAAGTFTSLNSTTAVSATSITTPLAIGGTTTTSALRLRSTSGVGTTGADIILQTGNNGATEAMRVLNNGNVGIGTSNPAARLHISSAAGTYNATADQTGAVYIPSSTAAATGNFQGISLAAISGNSLVSAFNFGVVSPATGYSPAFVFSQRTGASTYAERMRIDSAGLVGIGTTAPARHLHVASTNPTAFLDRDGGNPASIGLRSSRGTIASPTQTLANDTLGLVNAFGYTNASAYSAAGRAALWFYAAEAFTATAQGTYITLETTPTGSTTAAERMRITSAGNVGFGTTAPGSRLTVGAQTDSGSLSATLLVASDAAPATNAETTIGIGQGGATVGSWVGLTAGVVSGAAPYFSIKTRPTAGGASVERLRIDGAGNVLVTGAGGLGYGTGSGGAVTQGTSRTQGVTLDKTNGAITLFSAAGTTTWQSFTVTNNKVAATDTIIVNQKSGTDLYEIHVTAVAAGSFRLSYRTTGGTTTEQPVFNFAVIKAVTA